MKRTYYLLFAMGLLVVGAAWYRWHTTAARPAPEAEVRAAVVVPSAQFINVEASADYYREQILRHPDVVKNYVALAQLMMQQARTTADEARYIPKARALLDDALHREPDNYHALVLRTTLLNTLHRFEEASELAEQLIARYPGHAYNYGTLTDALVELGRYDEAVAVCDKMLELRPDLASYARASYLRELHGDADGAIAAMRLAADAGAAGHEDRAWALYQLGHLYLGQNKPDTAAFIFNGILDEVPGYARAIGGLAHVRLVKGATNEAIDLLEEAYAEAPDGTLLDLLAEAYQRTGDQAKVEHTLDRIEQGFRDAEQMGENVDMEYADFLADHGLRLDEAWIKAQREIERRPDHLHALETYAWVLYRNGRAGEAVAPIRRAMRLGTGDAMVQYRAGMIYRAAGQPEAAAEQFEQALANHLHIESHSAAETARATLASLR